MPEAEPDSPENFVSEQHALDAKGAVRDIVAAGDGSVVMVQTNQPPYWQPLDLKTGQWIKPPWKAAADTLLATQAGKIYLISKSTKILEIWDLATGKRDGMQLLPLEGEITAVAAPLTDSARPVFIATDTNAFFLDPVKFEVIPGGLNLESCFVKSQSRNRRYQTLKPGTIWLRASSDGARYTVSGTTGEGSRDSLASLILTVDPSSLALEINSAEGLLPSRGRNLTRGFPDHGGNETAAEPSSASGVFPGSPGQIRFVAGEKRSEFAVMKNPPVLPVNSSKPGDYLLSDRGVYHDSTLGVVLLPDGDKLHFMRVKFPDEGAAVPEFWFPGEVFEIPLPPGSGHTLKSDLEGETVIGATSAKWTVPAAPENLSGYLRLEWTGELGSQINKEYRVRVVRTPAVPTVESPDGKTKIPLHRRSVLSTDGFRLKSFAGSGHVAVVESSEGLTAWNLAAGERMFDWEGRARKVVGDADRLYILAQDGKLVSYDLETGKLLAEADMGKSVEGLTTGIASRHPLIAVERETLDPYLSLVQRDTLKSVLTDFPRETQHRFFSTSFQTNASGSATWSNNTAVFRDRKAITIKPFEENLYDGEPDASGRYIVGSSEMLDLGVTPPRRVPLKSLPGMGESTSGKLDESGHYLLLSGSEKDGHWKLVSVRDIQAPARELFKIRFSLSGVDMPPWVLSDTKTLVREISYGSNYGTAVYDFDVPAILKALSR